MSHCTVGPDFPKVSQSGTFEDCWSGICYGWMLFLLLKREHQSTRKVISKTKTLTSRMTSVSNELRYERTADVYEDAFRTYKLMVGHQAEHLPGNNHTEAILKGFLGRFGKPGLNCET